MSIHRIISFLLGMIICTASVAAPVNTQQGTESEFRVNAGILNGSAESSFYDATGSASGTAGYLLSKYELKMESVKMAGIGMSGNAGDNLRLNLDYWSNVGDGDSTADYRYYDWNYGTTDWTDWSHHDNTTVTKAQLIDISGEYIFSESSRKRRKSSWSVVAGYKQDTFDWAVKGGSAVLSTTSLRDTYVSFADVPLLSYQQVLSVPYIGLNYRWMARVKKTKYEVRAGIQYSPLASGKDTLNEIAANQRYEAETSGGQWYKANFEVEFNVSKKIMFTIGYIYQNYSEMKGTLTQTDLTSSAVNVYPDNSSGVSNKFQMYTIGISYRF